MDHNQQKRGIAPETLVERTLAALQREYILVGKAHVRVWHVWLCIGILAGIVFAVGLVANRSGKIESSLAATLYPPSSLIVTVVSSNQVNLTWVDTNSSESGYSIERSVNTATNFKKIATVGKNITSYNNTSLVPATVYYYRVRAYYRQSWFSTSYSAYSSSVSVTTPSSTADTTSPSVPTGLTASAISSSQINLSWIASTDNVGVAGYRIYRGGVQIATSATNSYQDTGLTSSTLYSYTVAAYDAAGNVSVQSTSASATTQAPPDLTAPSVPTGLSAAAISSTQINLAWTASTDNVGVAGYRVYRGGTQIATVITTPYSNTGLSASTAYSYTVSAYDAAGNVSAQSVSVSATTLTVATPCAAPFPSDVFCGDYYTSASAGQFTTFKNKVVSEGATTTPFLNYNPFDATLAQAIRCGQSDRCAVRWQGNWNFNAASYTFSVTTDDGIRFYIDGALVIDKWFDQGPTTYTYTQNMTSGMHLVKVEYYENGVTAAVVVGWTQNVIPSVIRMPYRNSFENTSDFVIGAGGWSVWTNGAVGSSGTVERYYSAIDFPPPGGESWSLRMQSLVIDPGASYPGLYAKTSLIAVSENTAYRAYAFARNNGFDASFSVISYDAAGNQIDWAESVFRKDAWSFDEDVISFTTSSDTKYIALQFRLLNSNAVVDIDLALVRIPYQKGVHSVLENDTPLGIANHIASLQSIGVEVSRNGFEWALIEPVKGQRDWTRTDEIVNRLRSSGIEPQMGIATSPSWASGVATTTPDYWVHVPTTEPQFTNWLNEYKIFVHDLAMRYKDRVQKWELWNEPNHPDFWKPVPNIELYARWSSAIAQEIKAVDSSALIAFGSLVIPDVDYGNGQIAGKTFLQGLYDRGVFPDIVSIHPYQFVNEPPDQYSPADGLNTFRDIETIKSVMDANGQQDTDIWLTEFSWRAGKTLGNPPITMTEDLQAANLKRALQIIRYQWPYVTLAEWFWDNDRTPTAEFDGYGLIRADQSVRPAGTVFRDFTP